MRFSDFEIRTHSEGLLPVIVQNCETLQILTIGYMNEEAFRRTQESGLVTFYSRSRHKLHVRGEHSGHYLHVVNMTSDHRKETLLISVRMDGNPDYSTHLSSFSTTPSLGYIRHLEQKIKKRHQQLPEGSYTTHLFEKGKQHIGKKMIEKSTDCLIYSALNDRQKFLEVAADHIYHMLVMMETMDCSLTDVEQVLSARYEHKKSQR